MRVGWSAFAPRNASYPEKSRKWFRVRFSRAAVGLSDVYAKSTSNKLETPNK